MRAETKVCAVMGRHQQHCQHVVVPVLCRQVDLREEVRQTLLSMPSTACLETREGGKE